MPVSEMLQRIDSREIAEWMAYCRIEADRMAGKPDSESEEVSDKLKAVFMPYKNEDYVATLQKKKGR